MVMKYNSIKINNYFKNNYANIIAIIIILNPKTL
jgi:hypothetical protein